MHLTETQAYLNKRKNILGYAHGGYVQHLADGGPSGMVSGPGTSTSDSIPTMLSNGEFVINAASTRVYRPLLDAINSGARVAAPTVMSRVTGGGSPELATAAVELRAAAANLRNAKVEMDGRPVGQIVSRHIGRETDQRRRTG